MAEAVAGLLASAFVSIAKDKLGSAIAEQANLCWNFGGDLEDMKDTLVTISAMLEDAERRSVMEKQVQELLKRLKDVALDISDVLEDYQDDSDQATAKNPVLSCIPTAYKKMAIANRMKSLRKELTKINMKFGYFKFIITEGTSSTNVQHYDKLETTSHFLPEVEGREGDKQEIINLLLHARSNHDESETVIVPIYALGGMGKTTLAQLVYNDDQFKKQYDCHIWVYVSQDFNLLKIGNSIISRVTAEGSQHNRDLQNRDLQEIMDCLHNLLCNKKVLIILDDLWEENETELSKLRCMLQVGKKGSMIDVIVTTRQQGIARKVSTSKLYKLQPLKDDVCWEIIKKSSQCDQKEFEQIGQDIAKKCGGLPLAAQALGYILKTNKNIAEWQKMNDSDIWKETSDDGVIPSLRLSYQKMPRQLRICFSYCAIFSKGHNIVEDDLIHQWTVLGFVETSKGKEYIKNLLEMSFLQVSKMPSTSLNHEVQYTMHDLVHDLAKFTMADQLKIYNVAPPRKTSGDKYFRYSLLKKYDSTTKLENMPSKMRALHFSYSDQLNIQSGAFSSAMWLRILDFSECSRVLLPASIGKLKQLRCLIAPRMQNETLPKCITELSKLQYLNLNQSPQISTLPDSVCKLGCLKYLGLSGCSAISELPESFGDLKCMVHLDMSGCSGLKELMGSIGNLTHLQHLELSGCSSLKTLPESLCALTQLQYLNLSSCSCLEGLPVGIGSLVGIQHLYMSDCKKIRELPESLMNLQSLLHLNMSGCNGTRGSLACLHGLTTLQHLDISHCGSIHDFGDFGNNLKYLSLGGCYLYSYDFIATLTNLEYLDLSWNRHLRRLPESIANLKRLHTLDISYCFGLQSLPECIGTLGLKSLLLEGCSSAVLDQANSLLNYLQTLPIFKVRADEVNGCSNLHLLEGINVSELRILCLENVRSPEDATKVKLLDKHNLLELKLVWSTRCAVRFVDDRHLLEQLEPPTGLKRLHLQGYRCTRFPGWLMCIYSHLPNLVCIELLDMPTCSKLPPLGQLPHLEKLLVQKLPGIKRIDREFCGGKGAFRRLSSLSILDMKGLEEWNTTCSIEDGVEEFMFPVLDSLMIINCPKLRVKPCPPTFRECNIAWSDQVISSLEEAEDKISQISLSSSRAIKLDLMIMRDSCQSIGMFHHFPALKELKIYLDTLTSFPESIRHLTSLESLTLEWCGGIAALPEWLGDLSSLKSLLIFDCPGIKSLPACIQRLTKLQKLEIRKNRKLKEWCKSEENKAKIAHINIIHIDGTPLAAWQEKWAPDQIISYKRCL